MILSLKTSDHYEFSGQESVIYDILRSRVGSYCNWLQLILLIREVSKSDIVFTTHYSGIACIA